MEKYFCNICKKELKSDELFLRKTFEHCGIKLTRNNIVFKITIEPVNKESTKDIHVCKECFCNIINNIAIINKPEQKIWDNPFEGLFNLFINSNYKK